MIAAVLIVSVALLAQVPARDAVRPPAATGNAAITGVISTDTQPSKPLRRALVWVTTPDDPLRRSTVTDDAGKFQFAGLPAGRYTLGASRPGWVTMSYGAKQPARPGTSVALEEGQVATVAMRLPRAALITGVVVDSAGQPIAGVSVQAMRYGLINGERRLMSAGTTSGPDERGAYRIYGLAPGEYYVSAGMNVSPFAEGRELQLTTDVDVQQALQAIQQGAANGPAAIDAAAAKNVGFVPVYYPGTAAPAQATLLTLRAGEERSGIDFPLSMVPTARVDGLVSSPDGAVPAGTQITLIANEPGAAGVFGFRGLRTARARADGRFEFSDVVPGSYVLAARVAIPPPAGTARPNTTAPIMWATTDIAVEGQNLSGVSLMLQPGLTVTGSVRFDGAGAAPDAAGVRVSLAPAGDQVSISSSSATPDASGRFTIAGISPGRYRVNATMGNSRGWTHRGSAIGGEDTRDRPIEVRAPIEDLVVTFTDRPAQLDGQVQKASGTPSPDAFVIVFPADRAAWYPQSRRIQSVRPSTDGRYSIKTLPAGDYLVAATDDVEPGEWFDPAFLQRLTPSAIPITIADGEKKTQDIRAGGG